MFSLIRRISYSIIPRADRPWTDDGTVSYFPFHLASHQPDIYTWHLATSNAPQAGKKRRLSSTERERDPDCEESRKKKVRGDSVASSVPDPSQPPLPQAETAEVKYVTQGVNRVELTDAETDVLPETIPLPEEEAGELDEPTSSPAPPAGEAQEEPIEDHATDDVASSVNGDVDDSPIAAVVAEGSKVVDEGHEGAAGLVPDEEATVSRVAEPKERSDAGNDARNEDTPHNDD